MFTPIKTATETIFLYYLNRVIRYFIDRGYTPRILRTDYFSTFISKASETYYTNIQQHRAPNIRFIPTVAEQRRTRHSNTSQQHLSRTPWPRPPSRRLLDLRSPTLDLPPQQPTTLSNQPRPPPDDRPIPPRQRNPPVQIPIRGCPLLPPREA